MMTKRWLAAAIASLLLLSGCGRKESPPPEAPPAPAASAESPELAAFRKDIAGEQAALAAAYLGYAELTGYEDLTVYLEACGFYELYPFLSEVTEEHFVQQEGGELYLLVPVSAGDTISVCTCYVDEVKSVLVRGEALLQGEAGQPLILQGNVSEIAPNLWSVVENGGEPLEYAPSLSLMDGTLSTIPGVYDFSDYAFLEELRSGPEAPVFCGTWYAQAADGDGVSRAMTLSLWSDGYVEYYYGIPESDTLESFAGYWSEADGVLTLDLHGGPAGYEGSDAEEFAYDSTCSFEWDYQSRHLYLRHAGGDVLLYGTEGAEFDFLPFNYYPLAGTWSANALYRDWVYELSLLENGECLFRISEAGEELAFYEGWWSMTENAHVTLDLTLAYGQHPENPETETISGTYSADKYGSSMDLSFVSGSILTLNMEENGYESFALAPGPSCVSVHYAEDVAGDRNQWDWVIVDDTVPVEAAFCTMVPVEDFTVVSLLLRDDMTFEATVLYEYGTLTPERPLLVTFTDYGTIPAYGVSYTDPSDGVYRLFGIGISGVDGSLELVNLG